MRKPLICAIAASAVLSVSGAVPAYAAVSTVNIPGGRLIQISGSSSGLDCSQQLQKLLGSLSFNGSDCLSGIAGLPDGLVPGVQQPGICQPETGWPEIQQPEQQPGSQQPEQQKPENQETENQKPENQKPENQKPEEGTDQSAFAKEILNLVNAERSKAGLSPVTLHNSASKAAQVRAQEIQTSFSHTRPGGGSAASALNEAGVSYHGFGENIAYGQNSAEEVMREWMNSPGHRANILNGNFTSLGVGHTENAAGVDYWVQLFLY